MIDLNDIDIMNILQDNARTSNAEVARRVGLAPSAIHARLQKLETSGLIAGYAARLDAAALGFGLTAFIFVRTEEAPGHTDSAMRLAAVPEIQEIHHVAGEDCFLVKARVADTEALARLLRDQLGSIPAVRSTRTTVVLETIKETFTLPLAKQGGACANGAANAAENNHA
ncbi:Lrp/AsnC ligand binding domain-containing protein [soil metagenome]